MIVFDTKQLTTVWLIILVTSSTEVGVIYIDEYSLETKLVHLVIFLLVFIVESMMYLLLSTSLVQLF